MEMKWTDGFVSQEVHRDDDVEFASDGDEKRLSKKMKLNRWCSSWKIQMKETIIEIDPKCEILIGKLQNKKEITRKRWKEKRMDEFSRIWDARPKQLEDNNRKWRVKSRAVTVICEWQSEKLELTKYSFRRWNSCCLISWGSSGWWAVAEM